MKGLQGVVEDLRSILGEVSAYGEIGIASQPTKPQIPTLPFHTDAAKAVWETARKIATDNPEMHTSVVLRQAMEAARIPVNELTPEDGRLLEIGIVWAQKQAAVYKQDDPARNSGIEPYRTAGDQHFMPARWG